MLFSDKKIALIIGHPGHELRLYKFVELYKPRVYVITDGSGNTGHSRMYNTINIIEQLGAEVSTIAGYFSDKEIYRIILEQDFTSASRLLNDMMKDLLSFSPDIIVGDALEGFSPTHDLCRYIISKLTTELTQKHHVKIDGYDFLLDGMMTKEDSNSAIGIELSDQDFLRKYKAAEAYQELAYEMKVAIDKFGEAAFKTEYIRPVLNNASNPVWSDIPFYEKYGMEKIKAGVYKEAITYQHHMKPFLEWINQYSFDY